MMGLRFFIFKYIYFVFLSESHYSTKNLTQIVNLRDLTANLVYEYSVYFSDLIVCNFYYIYTNEVINYLLNKFNLIGHITKL